VLQVVATWVARKVFAEDAAIYEGVQNGVAASPHPGVIGVREERIYYFQKYVLDRTSPLHLKAVENGATAPFPAIPLPLG
jgi:hypothetical protein